LPYPSLDLIPFEDAAGVSRLTDGDGDGIGASDLGAFEFTPTVVQIEAEPGSEFKDIHLTSGAKLTVAVLGSPTVDVSGIDSPTLVYGLGQILLNNPDVSYRDVNGDGNTDLVATFTWGSSTSVQPGAAAVHLSGVFYGGDPIAGSAQITISAPTD
jgi:hypothetical protein